MAAEVGSADPVTSETASNQAAICDRVSIARAKRNAVIGMILRVREE